MLDRMGVPFNRTQGLLDFRRFGGRSTIVPPSPARRPGSNSSTRSTNRSKGTRPRRRRRARRCDPRREMCRSSSRGTTILGARRRRTCIGHRRARPEDDAIAVPRRRVCLRRAAPGIIFGRSTNSVICTAPRGDAYRQGAVYANGELSKTPHGHPRSDKLRLIRKAPAARGGAFGFPKIQATSASDRRSRARSRRYNSRTNVPGYGNSRARRHRVARDFSHLLPRASRHLQRKDRQERERSLPRPDAQGRSLLRKKLAASRDLRKVRRSRPYRPDEGLPRATIPWAASGSTSNGTRKGRSRRLSA